MGMRKIGDWGPAMSLISNLQKNMDHAARLSALRFALYAEKKAKEHMGKQDLGWAELKPAYKKTKTKKGQSDAILIRTSTYFQSITSWAEVYTGFAGVRRKVLNKDGEEVADIARIHEYGTDTIPKRPLWKPVAKEAYEWWAVNANPIKLFLERVKNG